MAQDVTPWLTSNYNPPSSPCLCAPRGFCSLAHLYANYPNNYCGDANAPSSRPSVPSLPLSALLTPLFTNSVPGPSEQPLLLPRLLSPCLRWSSNSCSSHQPLLAASLGSSSMFPEQSFPTTLHVSMAFSPDSLPSREQGWFSRALQGEILALDTGIG